MATRIKILSDQVANAIAAGEIIERPASVVKELIENSLDAGADTISIELKNSGHKLIQVRDNGHGMSQDDALLAFERHATSKVETLQDISNISSMGFRGEALPSIAAVSKTELITRTADEISGTILKIEAGVMKKIAEAGCSAGTTLAVKNLFYNLPARRKHMTAMSSELTQLVNLVSSFILSWPNIHFKLYNNNREILNSAGLKTLKDAVRFIYGAETSSNMIPLDFSCVLNQTGQLSFPLKIEGFISNLKISKASMRDVSLFVNKRPVKSLLINNTLKQAYHTVLPEKRFPLAVINLKIDPRGVDVNVHPNKHEVKFLDEKGITQAVHQAVTNAFTKAGLIIDIDDTPQSDHEHAFTGNSSDLSDLKNTDSNSIRSNNFGLKDSEKSKYKTSFSNNTENPVQSTIFSNAPVRNKAFTSNLNHADSVGSAGSAESTGSPESIGSPGPIGSGVPASRSKSPFETDSFEYNSKVFESNHPRLSEAIVKGQIFNTYILAENQNEMLMLDQHIVHERILYEQYMNQYFDSDFASQGLLFPLIIELSATDKQIMHKNMYILQKLGFTIEPFGGNNFLIKTVPVILGKIEEKEAIYEILDTLMTTLYVKKIEELKEALIIKTACHNAVKANQALNIGSMQNLVNMLSQTKNPYTCPHGRPIVVSLSEKEIKRRFKRT